MTAYFRCHLPDLPDEDFVVPSLETVNGTVQRPINSNSLLHPLILPRLYNPLFTLYALNSAKADEVYMERMQQLNKRGDITLMSFLEINRYLSILCVYPAAKLGPVYTGTVPCGTVPEPYG